MGTLAVCFVGLENLIDTDALEMMEGAGAEVAGIIAITKVAALAYLMFNLYTPPCFAAIGGTLITTGSIGAGFVPGLIAVIAFAAVLAWLCLKADKDLKQEYALNGARA